MFFDRIPNSAKAKLSAGQAHSQDNPHSEHLYTGPGTLIKMIKGRVNSI